MQEYQKYQFKLSGRVDKKVLAVAPRAKSGWYPIVAGDVFELRRREVIRKLEAMV